MMQKVLDQLKAAPEAAIASTHLLVKSPLPVDIDYLRRTIRDQTVDKFYYQLVIDATHASHPSSSRSQPTRVALEDAMRDAAAMMNNDPSAIALVPRGTGWRLKGIETSRVLDIVTDGLSGVLICRGGWLSARLAYNIDETISRDGRSYEATATITGLYQLHGDAITQLY